MSNTTIQIKRSSVTVAPTTLASGEPAYSYLSDKLFLGDASGTGVIAIGGKYFIDQLNVAFAVANAAFGVANSSTVASAAYDVANAAFGKANAANVLAYNTGIGANGYASAVGVSANAYATATFLPLTGGTISNDLVITGNLTISGETTYANTQTLLIGDNIFVLNNDLPGDVAPSENAGMEVNRGTGADVGIIWNESTDKWTFSNDGSAYLKIASNTDVESVAVSANAYADLVGLSANNYAGFMANSSNAYTDSVGIAGNTYANLIGTSANAYADFVGAAGNAYAVAVGTAGNAYAVAVGTAGNAYASVVGTSANAYADVVGAAANTNASNASYINNGTLAVSYGGTGLNSITANGVIYGNGTGAVGVTSAGSEGNVLQVNASGIPAFGMLDGGIFMYNWQ